MIQNAWLYTQLRTFCMPSKDGAPLDSGHFHAVPWFGPPEFLPVLAKNPG